MPRALSLQRLTRESRRPAWLRERPGAPWAAVGAVCLGAFMGQLDASIVTLTYPSLQAEFHAGFGAVTWVSSAYLAVLAVLLVPVGSWADVRGRKLFYLYGFALFTAASCGCALAPSLGWLIAARSVQAVGAALLQANSVALVVLSVRPERVRTALGWQGAAQAVGLALGPTLGGVLVDAWGWRSVFWVNLPIGVVAVLAGHLLLPRSRDLAERAGREPVSSLAGALLRRPGVGRSLIGAMVAYLLVFAPLVVFPSVFARWGVRPAVGGLLLSCLPAGFAAAAVGANLLGSRLGNHARVRLGALGSAGCLLTLTAIWTTPAAVALVLLALGACLGTAIPANNAMIMSSVPAHSAALAGGLVNVARAVGTALGVAVTVLGLAAAATHGWDGPPVVVAVLAGAALLLAATTVGSAGATHPTSPGEVR